MAKKPGVRVRQEEIEDVIVAEEAELPSLIIGPLYNVVEDEAAETSFDPLESSDQEFEWPSKLVGTVVDLAGTRNGLIDSQRRMLADFVPSFNLVDGNVVHSVSDSDVKDLSQDGFSIMQSARDGLQRLNTSGFVVSLDGETFIYNPEGGFSGTKVGDKLDFDPNGFTVESITSTTIHAGDLTSEVIAATRFETDNTVDVSVTPSSALPGRVVVTISGGILEDVAADDLLITSAPMNGLAGVSGTLNGTTVTGLDFGVSIATSDVEGRIVRVTDGSNYDFVEVADINTVDGTLELSEATSLVDGGVTITIMESQVGYVESITLDETEAVVVVPNVFSDSSTIVQTLSTKSSFTVYPEFEVQASYRALRKDLTGFSYTASSRNELLDAIDHEFIHYLDGLGFAVDVSALAQPNRRTIMFIPVDTEPDGETGLTENQDLLAGYQAALEQAESVDGYCVVLLDSNPAIDAALESHVISMSSEDEGAWRRGFMFESVPQGDFESTSGTIAAGKVSGGVAATGEEGNTVIRDSIEFVTEAEVVAGTKVVVTFPEVFAGEYTALGSTTDNDLILDGDPFEVVKEFPVASMSVTTSGGFHDFTGANTGAFVHVEAGDYAEATVDGQTYRLRIVSVLANGSGFTAEDELPATISWNTEAATDVSIIRTWDTVDFHIRPLSKDQKVAELISRKSVVNRRFTLTLDYSPSVNVGVDANGNPIIKKLSPAISLAAIAAKRSGLRSFDEISNMFLGAGIESVEYAYNYFRRSQLRSLSDAGFTLVTQASRTSQPYIRDMITSDTSSLVNQEEIVTSNIDWQSKSLSSTYQSPPGSRFKILNDRLLGVRAIQLDAILKAWRNEGRLIDFRDVSISRNELNKRQTDIQFVGVYPVAEKEIEFTINMTV